MGRTSQAGKCCVPQKMGYRIATTEKGRTKAKREGTRKGTYNPERLALIGEMVSEGFRTVDIANELGISESSVRYWKAKYFMK